MNRFDSGVKFTSEGWTMSEVWLSSDLVIALFNMRASLPERSLVGYLLVMSSDRPVRIHLARLARESGYAEAKLREAMDSLVQDRVVVRSSIGCYVNPEFRNWDQSRLAKLPFQLAMKQPEDSNPTPEPPPEHGKPERLRKILQELIRLEEDTI